MRRTVRVAGLVCAIALAAGAEQGSPVPRKDPIDPKDKPAVAEFQSGIDKYESARKAAQANLPELKPTHEVGRINAEKRSLADAIRAARKGAKQGDVFTPAASEFFRRTVSSEMKGRSGKPARGAIKEDTSKLAVKVEVNGNYPSGQPLSMVPPSLLLRLPKLPKGLDYRFVGRALILRDSDADLIVDYLPDVVPAPQ